MEEVGFWVFWVFMKCGLSPRVIYSLWGSGEGGLGKVSLTDTKAAKHRKLKTCLVQSKRKSPKSERI